MSALLEQTQPYTVQEVAVKLRLSQRGVAKRCAAGTIPAYKEGRLWRIPRQMFDAWHEGRIRPVRKTFTVAAAFGGSASPTRGRSSVAAPASILSLTPAQFEKMLSERHDPER